MWLHTTTTYPIVGGGGMDGFSALRWRRSEEKKGVGSSQYVSKKGGLGQIRRKSIHFT